MDDKELNEKIAVKRGFFKADGIWTRKIQTSLDTVYCQSFAPNYCNDWRWCGELLDDLHDGLDTITVGMLMWHIVVDGVRVDSLYLKRAIAEAWDSVNP